MSTSSALPVVRYGDPILRTPGDPVRDFGPELKALAEKMVATMRAHEGIGLAAQQIGKAIQLCVLEVPNTPDRPSRLFIGGTEHALEAWMPMALVNPVIEQGKPYKIEGEGCLSFPDLRGDVRRAWRLHVKAQDLEGQPIEFKAEGLLARAIQHEVDHLKGILFIDRMDSVTKLSLKRDLEAMRAKYEKRR
jgi:peptide deformylase